MRRFPPENTNSKPQEGDAASAREADLITVQPIRGLGCGGWRSLGRCGPKATAIRRWKNWPLHAIPMSCAGSWSSPHGDGDRAPATGRPSACFAGCAPAPSLARWSPCCCVRAVGGTGSNEVVVVFPLAWISAQWLELGTADGTTRTVQVSDEAVARDERRVEPPLRRWAAARALRNDPARLEELLACADGMAPRHRDALLHGLLDAADGLDADQCRQMVGRALRSGIARVRRAALDRLCELDGPGAALRHARSDADRTVRAWRPRGTPTPAQAELPGIAPSLP